VVEEQIGVLSLQESSEMDENDWELHCSTARQTSKVSNRISSPGCIAISLTNSQASGCPSFACKRDTATKLINDKKTNSCYRPGRKVALCKRTHSGSKTRK
jgi:hypothetical protein